MCLPGPDHGEPDADAGDRHHRGQHPVHTPRHPLPQDDRHLALCGHEHDGLPPRLPHVPGVHHQEGRQKGYFLHKVQEKLKFGRDNKVCFPFLSVITMYVFCE